MSTLNQTDMFLIQQNGTTNTVENKDRSVLDPDDLFLVQRSGVTHTIKASDVGGGGGGNLTLVNLAPLSGTPDFEVTATTDLSEILPESIIHYQWYRYTGSTGGTGTLLKSFNSDSAILDTYTTTGADQGNYIGCTVTYLGTTVTETARTQCLTAPGPIATMYGLRFDPDRTTNLSRQTTSSAWNSFTFSFWAKFTGDSTSGTYFVTQTKSSGEIGIYVQNGEWSFGTNTGSPNVQTNEWQNIVASWDGTTRRLYVNGVLTRTTTSAPGGAGAVMYISGSDNGTINKWPGYLSEFYFAEEALPPEAFGKNFEPYGWGPLDSSQIKDNINNYVKVPEDGATWNTSQIWSDKLTVLNGGNFATPAKNAFDGTTSECYAETSDPLQMIFDPPITGVLEIDIPNGADFEDLDGNDLNGSFSNGTYTQTVSNFGGIVLKPGSGRPNPQKFKLDGVVLVDQGSFGPNGFYLPFDPSNTGVIYSSGVTASAGTLASNLAFNGAGGYTKSGATGDQAITVTMPANTSGTSFSWDTDGEATAVGQESNPTNVVVQTSTGDYTYNYPTTGGGVVSTETITFAQSTINAVVFTKPAANDGTIGFKNPKVNGKLLVDHDSIGVDASGNNNDFYDQNFALNTTGDIYTGSYTGSPYEGNWNNVFNGVKGANSASTVATYTSSGDTTMTLTTPFSGNLTVYASANAGTGDPTGAEVILTTGSGAVSVPCAVLATGNPAADHGISAGAVSNVTAITLKQASRGTKLYWLELDGVVLVDANVQDTVTDTPLMSYAVLSQGSNGNLINTSSREPATYFGEVGQTYYFEVDGGGTTTAGGSSFTSQIGSTYNFGQQPFAASNVTYNQATGIATVDGVTYNTLFQTWEQTKTALLKARAEGDEARISHLESIIINQAVPFDRDTQYPKGTIVNIRGQLFEAIIDGADVSIADFVSSFFRVQSPEWVNLDIKVPEDTQETINNEQEGS